MLLVQVLLLVQASAASQPAEPSSTANNTALMLIPMGIAMVMAMVTPPTLPRHAPPRAIYYTIPILCCGAINQDGIPTPTKPPPILEG